jgi:two-component system sensor histidine kinase/response regulator
VYAGRIAAMNTASSIHDEATRVEILRQYGILEAPTSESFEELIGIVAQTCEVPLAFTALIDEKCERLKHRVGTPGFELPREHSFAAHVLDQKEPMVVADLTKDSRFSQNPWVTGPSAVRFYAGVALVSPEGAVLGALSVIDFKARELTPPQLKALRVLAGQVMTHFDKHRQATALRLSEERFTSAFDHAPIGVCLVSLSGSFLKTNRALSDIVGYTPAELAKLTFQDLTHSEDLQADLANVRDLIEGRATSYTMEKRYYHKDGRVIWVTLHVSLARNREGKPLHFISQIQDITVARAALVQQKELTGKALAAERAKSEFLATMSHEIRTPLNGVIGMANILADTDLNDMQRECVETINTSGESLLAVINDILDYSKIEAGRLEMEHRPFKLEQCVEEAIDLFAAQIRAKHIEATYLVAPEIPARLVGDTLRLRQILVNLIGNAIKFTARGEIDLRVEMTKRDARGCHLTFSVKDSGIGIPEDKIAKLFQAFQQVDTSTSRRYGGSGLGLAICKRLTGMMRGDIWAESQPGQGSTFFFTTVLEPAPVEASNGAATEQPLRGRSALIVDDHEKGRHILESSLRHWGLDVTSCASASEALAILSRRAFDAGVVDLHMPGMDGIALARQVRDIRAIPLVLLTPTGTPLGGEDAALFHSQIFKPVKRSGLLNCLLKITGSEADSASRKQETKLDSGLGARHPLRILLAEDNPINTKVGLLMLSRFGFSADAVANCKLALKALETKSYDVVLMDIQMPEMNGIDATARIQEIYGDRRPVIVALTAEALEGDKERFLSLGFDYYLSKPMQPGPLQAVLQQIPSAGAARAAA